jgi:hypothetical protein
MTYALVYSFVMSGLTKRLVSVIRVNSSRVMSGLTKRLVSVVRVNSSHERRFFNEAV